MVLDYFADRSTETQGIGAPAWSEVFGIVIAFVVAMVGVAIAGSFSSF